LGAVGISNPSFEQYDPKALNEGDAEYGKAPSGAFWNFKQAGAHYVVPVAAHHDNFDMWDSKCQPRWNSVVTSGKDVVGMWQKATVANGLHFGVASHVPM